MLKVALQPQLPCTVDLVELAQKPEARLKRIITRAARTFHVEVA